MLLKEVFSMTNRIENTSKSIIDLVKVQMLPEKSQSTDDFIIELLYLLQSYGIGHSIKKPSLKYFKKGYLLFANDSLRAACGSIKWNGSHNYVQLELSGLGCSYFNATTERFDVLHEFVFNHQGVVKEIDIAVDDHTGKYSLRRINQDYTQGKFNGARGGQPKRKLINNDGAKSIRIGSQHALKQFLAYDKSREQNLPVSDFKFDNWTRLEVSLYSRNDALLSLDCLLNPDSFFVGAYPKVLSKVLKGVAPRCIVREQALKTSEDFVRSIYALKKQWGKTINSLQEIFDDNAQVISLVSRNGFPLSLALPSYLSHEMLLPVLKPQLLALIEQSKGKGDEN